ncbi:adipocyte plasma membrane-associated protein Hemomucin-like [Pectinophora gossypiella]|uniref:adipocyte plasma membrane-associated protein Hemomucin-like n=1 Tax=Pectinophora gossypiella TaxID=13191 RepID=UPI00214F414A|nr:adipocyte plasma membrane-associated protein Hemomucin-like [Pectinophora gossypiella]XP_049877788.1 adipocyte plasma membrane-associated protein Hemomucin-like [Pectinophora gossypiella]XP_049877789.1 adipocyte plasma membrane-associated protein Hemomucin-like [Pectinophora gossypiella]XP_049877790.1 adipocyte plasma membrane-associated protein Hemomucin-like [Pectinophora gossypiella]
MGFIFGLLKRLVAFLLYFVLFVGIIVLIPNLPPYTKFSSIELEPTLPRDGPLALNGALNNAEKLYKEKLVGPEGFQVYNGEVYTSLLTGEIVKLSPGGHVTFVTKIGQPCTGPMQEHKCGRPLGFEIDGKTGKMYVADAYYGIWKVDLKTDKKQLLVSPRVEIAGRAPKLFNSLALAKNGDIYWTDSTSDFHLHDGAKSMLADPSGRLFHYNAATNHSVVLLDDLWFANGVAISPDNQFVVVSETSRHRLVKYYIDGPKKGKSEVFLAGLPAVPDNLRALPDGSGVQVGLYVVFEEDQPLISRSMAKTPIIRKFIARILTLAELPFEFLNNHFPNAIFERIVYNIGSFRSLSFVLPRMSGLMVVDWNGKIVETYYNTDGSLSHISDAVVYKDKLYTGAPHSQNFVGAVPAPALLKKAYASVQSTPPPKTAETVTKKVPKPTEAPKPKVEEKPKVEQKKEAPKVAKPAGQQPPKPVQQAKPAEPVKTTTPKPVEKQTKPAPATPTTKPPPPKEAEKKSTTPKPPVQKPEPVKPTTPSPKQAESKPTPKAAPTTPTPPKAGAKKSSSEAKPAKEKPVPEAIPIKEEIPSDTAKPNKETLKVIKKGGPTEIPNPEL